MLKIWGWNLFKGDLLHFLNPRFCKKTRMFENMLLVFDNSFGNSGNEISGC